MTREDHGKELQEYRKAYVSDLTNVHRQQDKELHEALAEKRSELRIAHEALDRASRALEPIAHRGTTAAEPSIPK